MKTEKMTTPSKSKKEGKEYRSWEKTIRINDIEKKMSVEEAENGFVIRICGYDYKNHNEAKKKVYISNTNPLEMESPKEGPDAEIMKAVEEFNDLFN